MKLRANKALMHTKRHLLCSNNLIIPLERKSILSALFLALPQRVEMTYIS